MKLIPRYTQKAFTMVEMLVAVTIIAILILPLAGFLSGNLKRDERTLEARLALSVASQTMERLLAGEMSAYNIHDDSSSVNTGGKQWVVVIDPIDGQEMGEPANGTDPLEIRIRVYSLNNKRLMARLTALKGQ